MGETVMKNFKKLIAVLLVAATIFIAVPLRSNNNAVLADVTYVDREQKVPNFIDGIYSFLDRLYYIALGRTTDPDGRFTWFNHIIYDGYTGADLVRGILFSPEFLNKNCSNEEFESMFDSLGIDINPELLGEAEETED